MTTLPYLLTASLCMALFYGCYWLLLRQNTFFALNRAYLLVSIILSLSLPFIELPDTTVASLPLRPITLPTFAVGNTATVESVDWSISQWLWLVYGIGVLLMLLRLGVNSWSVFRLIRRGAFDRQADYTVVHLPDDSTDRIPSFSFGRYLVLNAIDAKAQPIALLCHEEAHIRQFHTVDILFLEVVQSVFWFNPVLLCYKRALQETHEFLADQAAIYQLSAPHLAEEWTYNQTTSTYAQQLVAYTLNVPVTALTTPFASTSTLKQRIVMLQKPQTHRWALFRYVLMLPLAACLVMCTQLEQDQPFNSVTSAQSLVKKAVKIDDEIFTVVEQQPEFPGGTKQLWKYLSENLHYPAAAQKVNAEGRVFVSFVVTKTGEVTDVNILKDIGFGTDEEAKRVVSQMPRWIPARQNGQVVNVRFNLPINFQLKDNTAANDFWQDLSKYTSFSLDGKKMDEKSLKAIIRQTPKERSYFSFYINEETNSVVFNHVNKKNIPQ